MAKTKTREIASQEPVAQGLTELVPSSLRARPLSQLDFPRIAKDERLTREIEAALPRLATTHRMYLGDARTSDAFDHGPVHLVVTSPPYWNLKEYNNSAGQLGHIDDYDDFLHQLDKVWSRCFDALVPGGRLVCVVGDVCVSRRNNNGRHAVVPLHASILERCRRIGFDSLATVIWHKIANAAYEVEGAGGFLGKPYEPNAVIKNDIEFILMLRKPGAYRKPALATRIMSVVPEACHRRWFQQIWTGITGASTRQHPAPFPVEIGERLVRMFSFVGDTVLDPFSGAGTTSVAAARCGRNSVGIEIDSYYYEAALSRLTHETQRLFTAARIERCPT
ncbi:MAG: site-specific DNA-methyltransferase [Phycisphaerae bacterium]|nr:site-specific DNA-methyltransferase [Phycisphaerae bacterium]